jgi:hypothetical protein
MQQSPQDALHAQTVAHRCTALQVIQLSGYTEHEKQHIARLYLEKEVRKNCAIPEGSVELTDKALDVLIKQYCRESGPSHGAQQVLGPVPACSLAHMRGIKRMYLLQGSGAVLLC